MKNKKNYIHGMEGTRFCRIFRGIKSRCSNQNLPEWKYYGKRGIKNEWKDLLTFKNDMYESYLVHVKQFGEKRTTLDRINNNGNYSKSNCRWATQQEQFANSRDMCKQKRFMAISPEEKKYFSNNMRQFQRTHNLGNHISDCLKGERTQIKGWTFELVGGANE